MTEKLLVPDIGEFQNVEVIEVLVKEGQKINKNDLKMPYCLNFIFSS